MSYQDNTSQVLVFQGYVPESDYVASYRNNAVVLTWSNPDPQPTEQEITDAGNSQAFLDWYAENGGNETLTLRKRASDALDKIDANEALLRALAFVVMDEINILRAQHSLADRTAAQLRTAIKAKITSGDADT